MDLIKSETLKELSIALSNFQAHQQPIKPNSTNPFLKNKYADLTALIDGTKENLNANGFSVTQLLTNDGLTTILLHNSGEYIGSTFKIEATEGKGTNAAQEMGIAITYSRRYAYGAILGLVTDEDTDGSGKNKQRSEYEYQPPKKSSPMPDTPPPAPQPEPPGRLEELLGEELPPPALSTQLAESARIKFVNHAKQTMADQLPFPMDAKFEKALLVADKTRDVKANLLYWFLYYICRGKRETYDETLATWSKGRGHKGFTFAELNTASEKEIAYTYPKAKDAFRDWIAELNGGTPPEEIVGGEVVESGE